MAIQDQAKWTILCNEVAKLSPSDPIRVDAIARFSVLHGNQAEASEEVLERVLRETGILPPPQSKYALIEGAIEYEAIMAGEEIWDQLQGSLKTNS